LQAVAEKLPNLGPVSMRWLERVGVSDLSKLRELGADKVYQMVLDAGHEPNRNLWYGLKGAELGVHWQVVAEEERRKRS
jgi:DNA transformation protein and related proteins